MHSETRKRSFFIAWAAFAAVALAGCVRTPAPIIDAAVQPSAPLRTGGPDTFATDFRDSQVRGKDRISVKVLREPDLSLDNVRVGDDGFFDMPYIGRVQAGGRTTTEIAEDVRERLGRDYLVNPRVAVNVVDFASYIVTVEGAVTSPGVFQFQPDTTLIGALALARGPTRVARLRQVAIFRTIGGERSVGVFDINQVRSGRMIDPVLHPGDRVLVGFDGLSQAWQDFLQAAPLFGTFTRF